MADQRARRGVQDRKLRAADDPSGKARGGVDARLCIGSAGGFDGFQIGGVGQIPALGVLASCKEVGTRLQRRAGDGLQGLHRRQRAGGDGFGGHVLIDDLVDEAGVGPVLQQASDEVGQKVAVRADGGVDPAAGGVVRKDDVVQPFAHAMQALEFVVHRGQPLRLGDVQDRRDGVGVVGGELRVDAVGPRQQLAGVGDVACVRGLLAGEDRKAFQPHDLRPLHLGVPVGALDEAHHDLAVKPCCQRVQPVDHGPGPATVSLDDDAEPLPPLQRGVGQRGFDHLQRQGKAVGLLGVDVETQARGLGERRQRADAGDQFLHDPFALCHLVAGMQGRKLDGNPGIGADVVALGGACYGGDRAGIGQVVAPRVAFGARSLAQHVVAVGIALGLQLFGAAHRLVDRLAQDEVAAHLLHRAGDGGADHRFAQPLDCCAEVPGDAALGVVQHLAGQHQRPGGSIDQRRGRLPQMPTPVGGGDLVLDQGVHRLGVGDPQQGLGQAHQRDALVSGKAIFRKKDFHQSRLRAGPDAPHQIGALGHDGGACRGVQRRLGHQALHQCRLVRQGARGDDGPGRGGGLGFHGRHLSFRPA